MIANKNLDKFIRAGIYHAFFKGNLLGMMLVSQEPLLYYESCFQETTTNLTNEPIGINFVFRQVKAHGF